MKGNLKGTLRKYEIDETDIGSIKNFIVQFNHVIDDLTNSISYLENVYLSGLLILESTSKNLRKIELAKGCLNSMKEKQLEWKGDLYLVTKSYEKEIKEHPKETFSALDQITMF